MRIPLDVRHSMMNKYRGSDDGNFRLIASALKDLLDIHCSSRSRTKAETKCLQSLASDYTTHKNQNPQRVQGTCEWLTGHTKFLHWRQKDYANLLLVTADPGCGKSVLSRAMIDEALHSPDTRSPVVCYFFFKEDDVERKNGANALCALLHQLFAQKPGLLQHAMVSYNLYGDQLRNMLGTLWDILDDAASSDEAGEIVCILDALDECGESSRNDLINLLSQFYRTSILGRTKLRFFITSRPYASIERRFGSMIRDVPEINLRGEDELENIRREIDLVIDFHVPRISHAQRFPFTQQVQDTVLRCLKAMPHRTYLWLHFILEVLETSLDSTAFRLETLIGKLPCTVEDAYENILQKIYDSALSKQAFRVLHIIVAAQRPLTLSELNIAVSIDENSQEDASEDPAGNLDLESEGPFYERLRNMCGLFIAKVDSKVYLIHQTARDFLVARGANDRFPEPSGSRPHIWKQSLHLGDSHSILAKICLTYLSGDCFNSVTTQATDNALPYGPNSIQACLYDSSSIM